MSSVSRVRSGPRAPGVREADSSSSSPIVVDQWEEADTSSSEEEVRYSPSSPSYAPSEHQFSPASPQYSPSSPREPLVRGPIPPPSAQRPLLPPPPPVQRPLPPIESLPTSCQICFNHFEPGKCLAHRCEGNCTSLICGTCIARMSENKCVQNCGNSSDHPGQHSHYSQTADDALTKVLYERGLPERVRELETENGDLKSGYAELERVKEAFARRSANFEELERKIVELEKDVNYYENLRLTQLEEAEAKNVALARDLSNAQGACSTLKCWAEGSDSRARAFENELDNLKDKLQEKEDELQAAMLEIEELRKSASCSVASPRKRTREETLVESIANVNLHGGEVTFTRKRRALGVESVMN